MVESCCLFMQCWHHTALHAHAHAHSPHMRAHLTGSTAQQSPWPDAYSQSLHAFINLLTAISTVAAACRTCLHLRQGWRSSGGMLHMAQCVDSILRPVAWAPAPACTPGTDDIPGEPQFTKDCLETCPCVQPRSRLAACNRLPSACHARASCRHAMLPAQRSWAGE